MSHTETTNKDKVDGGETNDSLAVSEEKDMDAATLKRFEAQCDNSNSGGEGESKTSALLQQLTGEYFPKGMPS